jgi:hypothetical protein
MWSLDFQRKRYKRKIDWCNNNDYWSSIHSVVLIKKLEIVLSVPVPAYSSGRQGEAGGKGVRGEFRPPSQSRAKSVRIFSNTHRLRPQ